MNDCCKQSENLLVQPSDKSDLLIRKCKICSLRHFELTVDPGKFGVQGAKL